ncbi:MAG: hypothetical protein RLZZ516_2807 [Cyanobacteriota bacterium]|jgi:hypothetical protein
MTMEPATIIAALGLLGAGVAGIWKIAGQFGDFRGRTNTCIEHLTRLTSKHDERISTLERAR